jgi:Amt family ammonium transporter
MKPSRVSSPLLTALFLLLASSQALAESAPYTTTPDKISAGDTAWMLTSTALVLLMTLPGLALFYAGMVRKKNVLATLLQSFAVCCLVTALWVAVGYSAAFTPGSAYLGGFSETFLNGMVFDRVGGHVSVSHIAPTIPESVFVMFQLTFAIITPALITGAFAERMKFGGLMLFMALWSLLVYVPVAHWVWEPGGWLASMGALDFAGGTVVHINAGAAGLVCAFYLGKRHNYGREPFFPNNLGLTMIGSLAAVGGLVRFQRRVGGGGGRPRRAGDAGDATGHGHGGDDLDAGGMDPAPAGVAAGRLFRRGGGSGGHYPGVRLCRGQRRVRDRHGGGDCLLLGRDRPEADAGRG